MDNSFENTLAYKTEGWLKIGFMLISLLHLPLPGFKTGQLLVGFFACLLGLIRQTGGVKLNLEFLKRTVVNEFGSAMFYLLFLVFIESPSMAFMLPLNLFFIIGAAEFVNRKKIGAFLRFEKIRTLITIVLGNKESIKRARVYCEFFLLWYVAGLAVFGKISILAPLLAFNYLRVKGISPIGRAVFFTLQKELSDAVTNFSILKKIVVGFFGLLTANVGSSS